MTVLEPGRKIGRSRVPLVSATGRAGLVTATGTPLLHQFGAARGSLFSASPIASHSAISARLMVARTMAASIVSETAISALLTGSDQSFMESHSAISAALAVERPMAAAIASMSAISAALTVTPGGPSTITFLASASSDGTTITIPASAQAGDLAVLFDLGNGVPVPTTVVPTGFTSISNTTLSTFRRTIVSYKILEAGDPGASITGLDGTSLEAKVIFVFRGDVPISSVTPSVWNSENTGGNPAAQTISASGQVAPLIVLGAAVAQFAEFSAADPAFDAEVENANSYMNAGYKIYNSSPADHSINMADLGLGNTLLSGYLLIG